LPLLPQPEIQVWIRTESFIDNEMNPSVKMTNRGAVFAALIFLLQWPAPVSADPFAASTDIGVGIEARPAWEGSSRMELGAYPVFQLYALRIPGLLSIHGPEDGFSMAPSIGYIGERKASSDHVLAGLGNVDAAYELGTQASYRWEHVRLVATLRYGIGGYSGLVGSIGADGVLQPSERLAIEFGPRLDFAGHDYMQTYFGVDADQSRASGYRAHNADEGLKSAGLKAQARLALSPDWALVGNFRYDRLVGDAGASPIVAAGSPDQLTVGIGLSTHVAIGDEAPD
jgi:MipA family protein